MAIIPGQLPLSNPENIISAAPGAVFFRDGDRFFLETNGTPEEIQVNKKSFGIHYRNEINFESLRDETVTFAKQSERWIKTGTIVGKTGWRFFSDKDTYVMSPSMSPTPTPTVTPSDTPPPPSATATPTPTATTTATPTPSPGP